MSLHRATLLAFSTLLTIGTTSVAFAGCCEWGTPAPVVYASSGCGGCGATYAPITYAAPVTYAPPPVAVSTWGAGCGCGRSVVYAAPAIEPMPIAPAPIYVVNQGPDYSGPGIEVPYQTYTPPTAYAPSEYPYVPGYRPYYHHAHFAYREHVYAHPHYYGPAPRWHAYPHRPLNVRD